MRFAFLLLAGALWVGPACAQHDHRPAPPAGLAAELAAVRAAVARYENHDAAVADGYRRFERGAGNPLMGEHWYRPDVVREPLDLQRPSTLIYATIDGERRLVAVAWTLYQRPGEPLPEGFAGDADRWHVHHVPTLARALVADRPLLSRLVERRIEQGKLGAGDGRTELTMLHAWIGMENPDGVFANGNVALPYAEAKLPVEWARADDPAAARGTALLLPEACADQAEASGRLAKLGRSQGEAILVACQNAAAEIGVAADLALEGKLEPPAFNAAAARAWRAYAGTLLASLTPEQRSRLAALETATTH